MIDLIIALGQAATWIKQREAFEGKVLALLQAIYNQGQGELIMDAQVKAALDGLLTQTQNQTTVIGGLNTFIGGIPTMIQAAVDKATAAIQAGQDPAEALAEIKQAGDAIAANTSAIQHAILVGTPHDPSAPAQTTVGGSTGTAPTGTGGASGATDTTGGATVAGGASTGSGGATTDTGGATTTDPNAPQGTQLEAEAS